MNNTYISSRRDNRTPPGNPCSSSIHLRTGVSHSPIGTGDINARICTAVRIGYMIRISTYQPPPSEGNSFFFGAIPAIDRLGLSHTSEKVQATEQIAPTGRRQRRPFSVVERNSLRQVTTGAALDSNLTPPRSYASFAAVYLKGSLHP